MLKGELGFDGFVISDWEGIHQLPGDYATQVRDRVNAGIDMFMEPNNLPAFETTLIDLGPRRPRVAMAGSTTRYGGS